MKKCSILAVPVALAVLLAGCGSTWENQAPEIEGIKDISCTTYSTVDLLDGVAALDREDGDITPNMEISIFPEVTVTDGYAEFTKAGEYEVTYRITDSDGESAEDLAFVTVYSREVYKTLLNTNGFSLSGSAEVISEGITDGEYVFNISGASESGDAVLSRYFEVAANTEYTFIYSVWSSCAGTITVNADGDNLTELSVAEGDNQLTFKLTTTEEAEEVKVDLLIGELGEDIEWKLKKVETEFMREGEGTTELLENFDFSGKILDRFDGTHGNCGTVDGGSGAYVEITQTTEYADSNWRGGMFVNTGLTLEAGETYTVSFDTQSENNNPFEVIIQRGQWDEYKFETVQSPHGNTVKQITVTESTAGALWLYVQSGNYANKITISNLSVTKKESGVKRTAYAFDNFTASHDGEGRGNVSVETGKATYTVESFGIEDWHNKLESPVFQMDGTGLDYVITFKAKASKPVSVVFAAPVVGGWDPVFVWQQFTIGEQEKVYTFISNPDDAARMYQFVWQFGSPANQKYSNVVIEISDITICYRSVLDAD